MENCQHRCCFVGADTRYIANIPSVPPFLNKELSYSVVLLQRGIVSKSVVVLEWLKISRQNGFEKQVETLEIKRAKNVVYFGFLSAM